jgi:hypothetical protein
MLYLVSALVPPLGVLLCGKPFQAIANAAIMVVGILLMLSIVGVPIGGWAIAASALHGILVAHNFYSDERTNRLIHALSPAPQLTEAEIIAAPGEALEAVSDTEPEAKSDALWQKMYGPKKWMG